MLNSSPSNAGEWQLSAAADLNVQVEHAGRAGWVVVGGDDPAVLGDHAASVEVKPHCPVGRELQEGTRNLELLINHLEEGKKNKRG